MGIFNRMIHGNPNKPDLQVEENQHPVKAFFEVFRIKLWELIKLNLLIDIFMVPAIAWTAITLFALTGENITYDTQAQVWFQYFLFMIPCFVIMGLALPSLNYITRSYAREFHVWMMEDFLEKLKENWKQSLLYMLLLGVIVFLVYNAARFYGITGADNTIFSVFQGILFVVSAILLISTTFVFPLMVTFELKFKQLVSNSILLAFAKLPQTLLILAVSLAVPVALLFISTVWQYGIFVLLLYMLIFGFSLPAFIINAYTNQIFKKLIAQNEEGELKSKPDYERK